MLSVEEKNERSIGLLSVEEWLERIIREKHEIFREKTASDYELRHVNYTAASIFHFLSLSLYRPLSLVLCQLHYPNTLTHARTQTHPHTYRFRFKLVFVARGESMK